MRESHGPRVTVEGVILEYTDTKHCPKCGENKKLSEFTKDKVRRDGLRSYCSACEYKRCKALRLSRRRWIEQIKVESGCVECGYNEHHAGLEFHHIEPRLGLCQMDGRRSLKWTKAEMAKCLILCAICHAILHYEENENA